MPTPSSLSSLSAAVTTLLPSTTGTRPSPPLRNRDQDRTTTTPLGVSASRPPPSPPSSSHHCRQVSPTHDYEKLQSRQAKTCGRPDAQKKDRGARDAPGHRDRGNNNIRPRPTTAAAVTMSRRHNKNHCEHDHTSTSNPYLLPASALVPHPTMVHASAHVLMSTLITPPPPSTDSSLRLSLTTSASSAVRLTAVVKGRGTRWGTARILPLDGDSEERHYPATAAHLARVMPGLTLEAEFFFHAHDSRHGKSIPRVGTAITFVPFSDEELGRLRCLDWQRESHGKDNKGNKKR